MKKLSTYLFLILFSFSAPSFGDDIRDFQIEGISIGDSLLDYFTEKEIKKGQYRLFKSKKYITTQLPGNFEMYDVAEAAFKNKDKDYKIVSLAGGIYFLENFNSCLKKKDEIVGEIKLLFDEGIVKTDEGIHLADKIGKSKFYRTSIALSENSKYHEIQINCINWSKKMEKKYNDNLSIVIQTDAYNDFLHNEAYK